MATILWHTGLAREFDPCGYRNGWQVQCKCHREATTDVASANGDLPSEMQGAQIRSMKLLRIADNGTSC